MSYSHQGRLDRQAIVNRVYTHFIVEKRPAGGSLKLIAGSIDDLSRPDLDFLHVIQEVHDTAMARANASNWVFEAYFIHALHNKLNSLAQRYHLVLPSIALHA